MQMKKAGYGAGFQTRSRARAARVSTAPDADLPEVTDEMLDRAELRIRDKPWIDPDDAPEITDDTLARAVLRTGDKADTETLRRTIARIKGGKEHTLTSAEVDELLASKTPLAFYRKRAGWSQARLAERTGIARGLLSQIEAGRKSGDVQTLRKIADLLKISLDDLVAPKIEG
jgi:DNA-binding XRE family transcriptional regulator